MEGASSREWSAPWAVARTLRGRLFAAGVVAVALTGCACAVDPLALGDAGGARDGGAPDAAPDAARLPDADARADAGATWAGFRDVSDRVEAPPLARVPARGVVVSGIAAVDLDEDGRLDLIATRFDGDPVVLRNLGGLRFGPPDGRVEGLDGVAESVSLGLGDVDGDGRLDVAIGRFDGLTLRCSRGAGRFEDCTAARGLDGIAAHVSSIAFADYDADGRLDLHAAGYDAFRGGDWPEGQPNALFRGGDERFEPVPDAPGATPDEIAPTLAATFTDLDDDGRLDLFVVNDFGPFRRPDQAFVQRPDGGFEERGGALGLAQRVFGMSASIGDLDGDGRLDAYVANAADNLLLVRRAEGGFVDRARALGAAAGHFADPDPPPAGPPAWRDFGPGSDNPTPEMVEFLSTYVPPGARSEWALTTFGTALFDADADGRLDVLAANGVVGLGSLLAEGAGQPNVLLLSRGDAGAVRFEAAGAALWPDLRGASRGVTVADLDGDGDLDVAWIDNGLDQEPGVRVLENLGGGGATLGVALEGRRSNRLGIGARVTLEVGGVRQVREVRTDVGFASAAPPIAWFGLGSARAADALEIRWPSGIVQRVTGVAASAPGEPVVIVEPVPPRLAPAWVASGHGLTFSSPRALDVDGDGVLDVVLGHGVEGSEDLPGYGGASAISGRDGSVLWRVPAPAELFTSATIVPRPGAPPLVVIGGRAATLVALDASDGSTVWAFDEPPPAGDASWFHFFTPARLPDLDGDGVDELVVASGGDPRLPPFAPRRAGHLLVVSGASGAPLAVAPTPDGAETYMSPVLRPRADGTLDVVFGTGGETHAGSLWASALAPLLAGDLSGARRLVAPASYKGVIAPPSLADLDGDGELDVVVATFDGRLVAIAGRDDRELWSVAVPDAESYASPAIGWLGEDATPDVVASFSLGMFEAYTGSVDLLVDGATGEVMRRVERPEGFSSSPLAADLDGDGRDEALVVATRRFARATVLWIPVDDARPVLELATVEGGGMSTPWLGDLDDDGRWELVLPHAGLDPAGETVWWLRRLDAGGGHAAAPSWGAYLGTRYDARADAGGAP